MYELPFADGEFDTVIFDDVLGDADDPEAVLGEGQRLLRPGGRLWLLAAAGERDAGELAQRFAGWCAATGLRLAAPRAIPDKNPRWLLAVATPVEPAVAAWA